MHETERETEAVGVCVRWGCDWEGVSDVSKSRGMMLANISAGVGREVAARQVSCGSQQRSAVTCLNVAPVSLQTYPTGPSYKHIVAGEDNINMVGEVQRSSSQDEWETMFSNLEDIKSSAFCLNPEGRFFCGVSKLSVFFRAACRDRVVLPRDQLCVGQWGQLDTHERIFSTMNPVWM